MKALCHVSLSFALSSGKDYISFIVVSKTVLQRIGRLLEIAKLVHFIGHLGILLLLLLLGLVG